MKRTIIAALGTIILLVSGSCFGQSVPKKDSIVVSDSTEYLSIKAIIKATEPLKDQLTARRYQDFMDIMQYVIMVTKKDWEDKKNKK
jgi:hypothetical protein